MKIHLFSVLGFLNLSLFFLSGGLGAQVENDLTVFPEREAAGIPANNYTPAKQLRQLYFHTPVKNIGTVQQEEVVLDVSVERLSDSTTFYQRSFDIGTLLPDQSYPTPYWVADFAPDHFPRGEYQLRYQVSAAATDQNPDNNVYLYPFEVTDSTFAKDPIANRNIRPGDTFWADGEKHDWAIGNYFFIPEDNSNNSPLTANSATFELTNPTDHPDTYIIFWLYILNDVNGDGLASLVSADRELFCISFNIILTTANDPSPYRITFPLFGSGIDPGPPYLSRGQAYLLSVQFMTEEEGKDYFIEAKEKNNYITNQFIASTNGIDYYTHALQIGTQNYYRLKSTDSIETTNLGYEISPIIELNINSDPPLTIPVLSAEHQVRAFPLPAKDHLQLQIDLASASAKVDISLFNSRGKQVLSKKLENIQQHTCSLDIHHLPPGPYFLHLHTDMGDRAMKIIIQ